MESSVASLMDHLNGVETRRRVVMMKRKEAETRLAFATEEQQQLEQQSALNEAREAELKKELDHLLEEQRQVQLQLMSGTDTVRHSEVEEALLIEHVRAQASKAEALVAAWRGHAQELDEVHQAWGNDDAAAPLQQRIAHLDSEAARLCGEKEQRERAITAALEAHALRAAGVAADPGQSTPTGDGVAAIQLGEQLGLQQRELAELQAQHARQLAALEREVADLTSRSVELAQWLTDTVGSRDQVLMNIQLLQLCLSSGICAACRQSS